MKLDALLLRQIEVVRAFPELVFAGHPILRAAASPVPLEAGRATALRLVDTLTRYRALTGMGVGLAAPQLGVAQAVFVTLLDGVPATYINPHITARTEAQNVVRELCLSSGVLWCEVIRPAAVELTWTDDLGIERSGAFDGKHARLLQHEFAHLEGRMNLDEATPGTIAFVDGDPKEQQLRPAP